MKDELVESAIYKGLLIGTQNQSNNGNYWKDLCEQIIPMQALIESKGSRIFSWNYDSFGRKLQPELSSIQEQENYQIFEALTGLDIILKKVSQGECGLWNNNFLAYER